jgi:hypothetical protein
MTAPVAIHTSPTSAGRGRFAVAAWLLGFVGIVGFAAGGRLAAGPSVPQVTTVPVEPPIAAHSEAPALTSLPELIVLSSPATANVMVTNRELVVRGYVRDGSGKIRVTLEARGNRIIDEATISPAPAFGDDSMAGHRDQQFETRFGLPNPRPNGRMIVQVALLDEDGRILDVIRRPFRVGPLLEAADG